MNPELLGYIRLSAESRVRKFRKDFGIAGAPVNCFRLLREIQKSGRVDLEAAELSGMSDAFDAQARYFPEVNSYLLMLRQPPAHWEKTSSRRRCHFTLAHELGHIFCGHLLQSEFSKSGEALLWEEFEANAFAAELLMPREVIGYFRSVKEAADALLVSETAMRRRMLETGLLYAVRTCPRCGFAGIPPAASYCRRCGFRLPAGAQADSKNGEEFLLPADTDTDELFYTWPRQEECPSCGFRGPGANCLNCETPLRNRCMREYNQEPHPAPPDAKYCEICGQETIWKTFL